MTETLLQQLKDAASEVQRLRGQVTKLHDVVATWEGTAPAALKEARGVADIEQRRGDRLADEIVELREENEQLSERCEEHRVTASVATEAMEKEISAFVLHLHEAIGGEVPPTNEGELLEVIRRVREDADSYRAIRDVMGGKFKPDVMLLKRIACAVGTSQFDAETVIGRAGILSGAHVKNAELFRELTVANQKIEALQEGVRRLSDYDAVPLKRDLGIVTPNAPSVGRFLLVVAAVAAALYWILS